MTRITMWLSCAILGLALRPSAQAAGIPFTFDPSLASPSLGGAAFTADDINFANYLHSTLQGDGSFAQTLIQPITGFALGGAPVSLPGLNRSYGLYFLVTATGTLAGGPPTYFTLNIALKADVNNNDGTPSATLGTVSAPGTIGFSNPAGVTDDVTLGSGNLIAARMSMDAAGVRHATYLDTFTPSSGESAFFLSPTTFTHVQIQEVLTTLPSAFASSSPDPVTRQFEIAVNGGIGEAALLVPEPTSLMLFAGGLASLAVLRRRFGARRP